MQTKESLLKKVFDKIWINKKFYKYSESKIDYDKDYLVSPVDWKIAYFGNLWNNWEFISKWWKKAELEKLLSEESINFANYKYLNIYLSPKNRHFFCFPFDVKIKKIFCHNGTSIFPIFIWIENIFKIEVFHKAILSNATISVIMETDFWDICFIAVWSLNVNHINIDYKEWESWKTWEKFWNFSLGSSIILIFPESFEIIKNAWDDLVIWEKIIKIV